MQNYIQTLLNTLSMNFNELEITKIELIKILIRKIFYEMFATSQFK